MKKKISVAATILLILVISGLAYFLVERNSADVNVDYGFLEDQVDKPDLDDPTLIRLPEKYSKETIQKSLTSQTQTATKNLAGSDKEIADYIAEQEDGIARSLPLPTGSKDKPAMNDLVFRVADAKGNIVRPTRTISKAAPKAVEDNFTFEPTVTAREKELMTLAYPIIESFYGARQNTDKIHVYHDDTLERGWCGGNTIHLDRDNRNDEAIHELAHAFRGDYMLDSLWEEGSAVVVTTYVQQQLGLERDEYYLTQMGYNMNFEGLPSTYDFDMNNAGAPWYQNLPYAYGSMILDKILMEDSSFFKKFNPKIYLSNTFGRSTIKNAISSVSRIEGETSAAWFSHQYPYINYAMDWSNQQQMYFTPLAASVIYGNNNNSSELDVEGDYLKVKIRTNWNVEDDDFDLRILTSDNQVLLDSASFITKTTEAYSINKLCNNFTQAYKDYRGLAKIEMTPKNNPSNRKTETFLKAREGDDTSKIMASSSTGAIGTILAIDAQRTLVAEANDGYLKFDADWLAAPGRYKLSIYNRKENCTSTDPAECLGTEVSSKIFNKAGGLYQPYYLPLADPNICASKISNVKPLNRGFSLTSTTAVDCSHVMALNGIPIERFWGKKYSPVISNLAKNRSYRYQLSTASDGRASRTIARGITTTAYADFKVIKSESFGNAYDDSFYQRITTNMPYDPQSVSLMIPFDRGTELGVTIRRVSDVSFDMIPGHLYNNMSYLFIDGLQNMKDVRGNPVYKFNWDLASFSTPVNPIGRPLPVYQIDKTSYAPLETISISTNFSSTDLADKLNQIELYRRVGIMDCEEDLELCQAIPISATLAEGKILVTPQTGLAAGAEYYLYIPPIIDNDNNYVLPYEKVSDNLSFQVQ